jgi:hypothetical protein
MLVEGSSMRSISRITGVSINTVSKLLEDAGEICAKFHDNNVRGVKATRVQCDLNTPPKPLKEYVGKSDRAYLKGRFSYERALSDGLSISVGGKNRWASYAQGVF